MGPLVTSGCPECDRAFEDTLFLPYGIFYQGHYYPIAIANFTFDVHRAFCNLRNNGGTALCGYVLRPNNRPPTAAELDAIYHYTQQQQEIETMARLSSDLQDAGVFTLIPKGPQYAHVVAVQDTDKNDVSKPLRSQAGAPMVQLDWEIDEGEYAGRKIRFDTIMLGGKSKEGKPLNLGKLCSFLHHTGTPWECLDCKNGEASRQFYIAEGNEDDKARELKRGNYYCPDCKSTTPRITYDTANFLGARCRIGVGTRKGNDDREFNEVQGYGSLD